MLIQKQLVVGSFACNCHILVCPLTAQAVIIDPGDEADRIIQAVQSLYVKDQSVVVKCLIHTHAHLDHIGATRAVAESLGLAGLPNIVLHPADQPLYNALPEQGRLFHRLYENPLPVDSFMEEGQVLQVGSIHLKVWHTPGHTPGSVCLELLTPNSHVLYTGDTLFRGSIGRTDLWGGNYSLLIQSIRKKIFKLNEALRVCPGHGPETTILHEQTTNPFFI